MGWQRLPSDRPPRFLALAAAAAAAAAQEEEEESGVNTTITTTTTAAGVRWTTRVASDAAARGVSGPVMTLMGMGGGTDTGFAHRRGPQRGGLEECRRGRRRAHCQGEDIHRRDNLREKCPPASQVGMALVLAFAVVRIAAPRLLLRRDSLAC